MSTTTGHELSPRAAAAYAAALRTLPNVVWAKSINSSDMTYIHLRTHHEGGIDVTVELLTVEECVTAIHQACDD